MRHPAKKGQPFGKPPLSTDGLMVQKCNKCNMAEHIEGDSEVIPQSTHVPLQVVMSPENDSAGVLNSEVMKSKAEFLIDASSVHYDQVGLKCPSCHEICIGPKAFKEHMKESESLHRALAFFDNTSYLTLHIISYK